MAPSVTAFPASAVNNSGVGTKAWQNLNQIFTDDGLRASISPNLASGEISNYLVATNFGFSFPARAYISRIRVDVDAQSNPAQQVLDHRLRIVKGGVIQSTDVLNPNTWTNPGSIMGHGGVLDGHVEWGVFLKASDINDPNFGVAIAVRNPGPSTDNANIDYISITVTYAVPGDLGYIF